MYHATFDAESVVDNILDILAKDGVLAAASFLANFLLGVPDVLNALQIIVAIAKGRSVTLDDVVILVLTAGSVTVGLTILPGVFLPAPSLYKGLKNLGENVYEFFTGDIVEDVSISTVSDAMKRLMREAQAEANARRAEAEAKARAAREAAENRRQAEAERRRAAQARTPEQVANDDKAAWERLRAAEAREKAGTAERAERQAALDRYKQAGGGMFGMPW